jgi:ubiquinone/menaquinone biosynthesis C-methylase UbiE
MQRRGGLLNMELEPPAWLYNFLARGSIFRRIYRRFARDLESGVPRGARLLDVGTGPGYLLKHLAGLRPDLCLSGLDLDWQMVRRGKRNLGSSSPCLHLLVGDAQTLPVASGVFDFVTAYFSFHIWPQPSLGLAEILRVLKPGGRAWIYEMNRETSRESVRGFAAEERLPFFLIGPGYRLLAWHHSLSAGDFPPLFQAAGVKSWEIRSVHHLFWRAEIRKTGYDSAGKNCQGG